MFTLAFSDMSRIHATYKEENFVAIVVHNRQ